MSNTLIIAEPGSTHEGRLEMMLRLIDCAAECGADVFKSQWTSSAQTMCDRRHAPEYLESYKFLEYPLEWHMELREHALWRGLQYACTAYIPGDPTLLSPFVDYLKISSFEAADDALLLEARSDIPALHHVKTIVSLGMGESRAWADFRLHCVSSYPAPLSQLNLRLCSGNGKIDGEPDADGFSDHSHDVRVGAWAVAAGASILETHFRLNTCDPAKDRK